MGEKGTVFAEEIAEGKAKSLEEQASRKEISQVRAVLGRADDPGLPPNAVDLGFMHHVYHHVSKPRQMLRGIWRGLKPGGEPPQEDRGGNGEAGDDRSGLHPPVRRPAPGRRPLPARLRQDAGRIDPA